MPSIADGIIVENKKLKKEIASCKKLMKKLEKEIRALKSPDTAKHLS